MDAGKDGRYVLGLNRVTDEDDDDTASSDDASDSEEGTSTSTRPDDDAAAADIEKGVASLKVEDEREKHDGNEGDNESSSSSEEEDPVQVQSDLLLECFQRAVVSLSSSSLPMPVSTFYANHVLTARPDGTTLDIRKSRWKKFGPFLAFGNT